MDSQYSNPVDKDFFGAYNTMKDDTQSSDLEIVSLAKGDVALNSSKQLLLHDIALQIKPLDIERLITTSTILQEYIDEELQCVNARPVWPHKGETHIRLQYHEFTFHPIIDWKIEAIRYFGEILHDLQDYHMERIYAEQYIWHDALREANRCYPEIGNKFKSSFDPETSEIVVYGLAYAVEIIVVTVKEIVASQTVNQEYNKQIINHGTREKEVILHKNPECQENTSHTEAQFKSSSGGYKHQKLLKENEFYLFQHGDLTDNATYRYNKKQQEVTEKNNITSTDNRTGNINHIAFTLKDQFEIGRVITLDNTSPYRTDPASMSTTEKPCRKVDTEVTSGRDLSQIKQKRTNKNNDTKILACTSVLAVLTMASFTCMPAAALPHTPGYHQGFDPGVSCQPKLSDASQNEDLFRKLECYIPSCPSVSKIIYEKTDVYSPEQWTPVFEWINKTNYHSLDVGNGYTLSHRHDYYAFQTNHILYIDPIHQGDSGKWRCVVLDANNVKYESKPANVQIYETPIKEKLVINPNNPYMVNGERREFTCSVDAIYPKPYVVWYVNGVEYGNGTSVSHKQEDGLWSITNTITVGFDFVGEHELSCLLKTKPTIQTNTSIDVKEAAMVLNPEHDLNIALQETSKFTILCSGVGYKPNIRWEKDMNNIENNDGRYTIENECDNARCTGSIKPTIHDSQSPCQHIEDYAGVYTCVISLELPYNSSQVSPSMNVYIPENLCNEQSSGLVIGLTILSCACVITTVIIVAVVVFLRKHRWRTNKKPDLIPEPQENHADLDQLMPQDISHDRDSCVKVLIDIQTIRNNDMYVTDKTGNHSFLQNEILY